MEKAQFQFLLVVLHLLTLLLLSSHGAASSNVVTLQSILIYTTHNWLPIQPTVYFACKGEKNTTILPDVKVTNVLYTFMGKESWQPLTELPEKKCKRCGFYKEDILKDDVFDEWELCPADFIDGNYDHFKAKEFNATFRCPLCTASETGVNQTSKSIGGSIGKRRNKVTVVIVGILSSVVVVAGLVAGIKYLQRRKREKDQARFIQLFQEVDEEDDEEEEEQIEIVNAA